MRRCVAELEPHDWSEQACRIRQEALDVEVWERRRRGRPIRLWSAQFVVRSAGIDADDALFRLACLAHPYHRIGDTPRLYSIAGPVRWPPLDDDGTVTDADARVMAELLRMYPVAAPAEGSPHGGPDPEVVAQVHATDHAAALDLAGRGVRRMVAPGLIPAGLGCWQVRQRVLFLAGPGDAGERAAELAATVVDARGATAATVLSVQTEEGRRDPVDGRPVHPAYDLGPFGVEALWDDVDADPRPPGDPEVLSGLLLRAAADIRERYEIGTAGRAIHMNANLCNTQRTPYPR
ncbi:hypothetical protein BJF85_25040 [Saccharomonospora sp. CUA-673]|nr:hypothetical protein BJF85_25040 [Saccharomonospora sp. CUA-673]